jgi:hypothetical protein
VMPLSQLLLAILGGWIYGTALHHQANFGSPHPHLSSSKEMFEQRTIQIVLGIAAFILFSIATENLIHIHRSTALGESDLCRTHAQCTLPPLVWFPEQVSPVELWAQ